MVSYDISLFSGHFFPLVRLVRQLRWYLEPHYILKCLSVNVYIGGLNLRTSLVAQLVKNLPAMQETRFDSWVRKIPWRRDRLPTPVFLGSRVAQMIKNVPVTQETWVGKIPWRREGLLAPVFWPREFHGLYSPWGHKELDMTQRLFTLPFLNLYVG